MKNIIVRHLFLFAIFMFTLPASIGMSQVTNAKNKNPFPVKYTSAVDQNIIIKTITLAPVYDNVSGIYSAPIQKLLIDLLQNDKVWGYSEYPNLEKKIFVETFDSKPNDVLDVLSKTSSQALMTALITKGPRGLNARLKLYSQDRGLILLEESFQDIEAFEVGRLREEFVRLYHNLKNKLPYRGFVLSRRALEVTLNLGIQNGVKVGQELTLAQVLKLNRHPKLKTLVGIEREIIGKVKVTKVEPYLSFAQIIFEKETGVVDVGAKVLPTDFVSYPVPLLNRDGGVIGDQITSPITPVESSQEQSDQPSESNFNSKNGKIGKVTLQGGMTQYKESTSLQSGGSVDANNGMAPTILVGAQLLFFKNVFVDFNIKQSYFNSDHNLAGATPKNLDYTYSRYSGAVGYNYYIEDSQWGPQVSAALGLTSYKTQVSDTNPTALTSTQTDGLSLKITGLLPLQPEHPFEVGIDLLFLLSSSFAEAPTHSGSSNSNANSIGLFATYAYSPNLRYRFDLTFENINASFSGTGTRPNPASSTTIKTTSQLIGIEYLF